MMRRFCCDHVGVSMWAIKSRQNQNRIELNLSNTFGPEYKLTSKTIEAFAQCKNIQVTNTYY